MPTDDSAADQVGPRCACSTFMGTLDNWEPAVTDPLAAGREMILFNNAGTSPDFEGGTI